MWLLFFRQNTNVAVRAKSARCCSLCQCAEIISPFSLQMVSLYARFKVFEFVSLHLIHT